MKTESVERHEVVVIGAGQAGLAAGYHLARRGVEFVILEASPQVGDVWRDRYDSLLLYSPAGYNALPGHPFPLGPNVFRQGPRWPTTWRRTSRSIGCPSRRRSGSTASERPRMPATAIWSPWVHGP